MGQRLEPLQAVVTNCRRTLFLFFFLQRLACSGSSGSGPVFYDPLEARVQLKCINNRTSTAHQSIKNLKTSCCTRTAGPCWVFLSPYCAAFTRRTITVMDFWVCSSIFTGQSEDYSRRSLPETTRSLLWVLDETSRCCRQLRWLLSANIYLSVTTPSHHHDNPSLPCPWMTDFTTVGSFLMCSLLSGSTGTVSQKPSCQLWNIFTPCAVRARKWRSHRTVVTCRSLAHSESAPD